MFLGQERGENLNKIFAFTRKENFVNNPASQFLKNADVMFSITKFLIIQNRSFSHLYNVEIMKQNNVLFIFVFFFLILNLYIFGL